MTAAMQRLIIGKTRLPDFGGEWTTRRLGDLADVDPENLPANTDPDHEFNYISLEQVEAGRLRGYTVEIFRTSPSRARRRLRRDDVLMSTVRPNLMGHLFFNFDNEKFANTVCSTGFAVLRCRRNLSVPGFLFAHLFGPVVNKQIERTLAGSNYPAISSRDVALIEIPCPSIREQTAIAAVLSDVDRLLESLDAVIAKKRSVKTAAMQQLLTGQIRLPGFREEWKKSRLGEIASVRDRKVLPSHMSPDTLCIELDHIEQENGRLAGYSTAEFSTSTKYRFFAGDVLFGRLRSYLRKYWHADRNGICTTEIWPLMAYPEQMDSGFLYTLVQTERFMEAASVSYGTHMPRAEWRVVRGLDLSLPPLEEQRSIARVHSDMDAEIDALERRRDKARALKEGMMQQLLTGAIQLVEVEASVSPDAADAPVGKGHGWQFNEAVIISVLANYFGNKKYPLSRMRYTKLSYLLHRHHEGKAEGYLKKAAGPYNPRTRYGGPEKIALGKGYVRKCTSGKYQGFIAGDNAEESERYFDRWYGREALQWLEQFRYKKNNDLELLTTVDMAIEELRAEGEAVSIESVQEVIHRDPEWTKKLARSTFSSANLERAIVDCEQLFGR